MTAFLGALPHSSSDSATSFRVQAADSPSVLPRIVGLFSKLTLVPDVFHAQRAADGGLEVEIAVAGLSREQGEHIAAALRQIIEVETVLVGLEKPVRASA
jgi:acetolactate synthase small subunit